jgi:hypothetical protein
MKYLIIVLLLTGCSLETTEYKCIDHKRFWKLHNIWSEEYGAMPCRSLEEVK